MRNANVNVEKQYKTSTVIWCALLAAQAMFLVIIFVIKPEMFRFDFSKALLGDDPLFPIVSAVAALGNFALSFSLSRKYINQGINERKTEFVQLGMIVGCVFCESVSLFGIFLAFGFSYQYFFLWFALGITGTLLHFPKRKNFIATSYKR